MNYLEFIGQKATESLTILSKKLQIYQICELINNNAEEIIEQAQIISETTTMTFQEALDKEIEKLQKELK